MRRFNQAFDQKIHGYGVRMMPSPVEERNFDEFLDNFGDGHVVLGDDGSLSLMNQEDATNATFGQPTMCVLPIPVVSKGKYKNRSKGKFRLIPESALKAYWSFYIIIYYYISLTVTEDYLFKVPFQQRSVIGKKGDLEQIVIIFF